MALLKESDREHLRKQFEQLQNPVKLVFFTQALNCDYCPMTQQVLEELAGLSDKIQLETYNFAIDREKVETYKVARIPALAIVRMETKGENGQAESYERDYGIRYYGLPSGYEFASLIGDVMDVSRGESGLSVQSKSALAKLREPVHFQVFVTPT
jgi:glutaredoxin-like protein